MPSRSAPPTSPTRASRSTSSTGWPHRPRRWACPASPTCAGSPRRSPPEGRPRAASGAQYARAPGRHTERAFLRPAHGRPPQDIRGVTVLIGASVLAFLVLLVLLAERGGERMWRGTSTDALFYCNPCDLRYRRDELRDQAARASPPAHYVDTLSGGFSMGTVAIFTCLVFI